MILRAIICLFLLNTLACQFFDNQDEFDRAEKYEQNANFKSAIKYYIRYIKKNPHNEKSVLAAEKVIKLIKIDPRDHKLILDLSDFIIKQSSDFKKTLWAQEVKANTYFESMYEYNNAILEYNKIIPLIKADPAKKFKFKLNVAKSYFSLNLFYQAEIEIKEVLSMKVDSELMYEAKLFEANLYLTNKKIDQAIEAFQKIISDYSEKAKKENLKKNLVVCYEEKEDFEKAILVLREIRADKSENPEIIDLKIEKLKVRIENQPKGKIR